MRRLEWSQDGLEDLLAIVDYISARNPSAAQALADDILAKTAVLPEHPGLHKAGRVEGTREMVAHRNYVVVYRESDDGVTILRVLHAARQWRITE